MHHALPGVVQVKAAAFAAAVAVSGCMVPSTGPQSGGDQAHLVPATGASILMQEVFLEDGRLFASYVSSGMATAHLLHDGVVLGSWPAKARYIAA